jgi:hypothetical protein
MLATTETASCQCQPFDITNTTTGARITNTQNDIENTENFSHSKFIVNTFSSPNIF